MTTARTTVRAAWLRDLRTFAAGLGCGFLGGALLVFVVLWQYNFISWPRILDNRPDAGAAVLEPAAETPSATIGRPSPPPPPVDRATTGVEAPGAVELKDRDLLIPVEGIGPDQLRPDFGDRRGNRLHEALDIPAPRNTLVRAVEDGSIARLFLSKPGGNTIYQFDPSGRFCYYYAHLERYADGLREGEPVRKGQTIGYVGTSGNAPKDVPHLHFAIFRLTDAKRWWEGTPIDPYDILR